MVFFNSRWCFLRGTNWFFKQNRLPIVLKGLIENIKVTILNLNDVIPLCMCDKFYCKVPSYTTIEYQL